jgi:hypothetical protein
MATVFSCAVEAQVVAAAVAFHTRSCRAPGGGGVSLRVSRLNSCKPFSWLSLGEVSLAPGPAIERVDESRTRGKPKTGAQGRCRRCPRPLQARKPPHTSARQNSSHPPPQKLTGPLPAETTEGLTVGLAEHKVTCSE